MRSKRHEAPSELEDDELRRAFDGLPRDPAPDFHVRLLGNVSRSRAERRRRRATRLLRVYAIATVVVSLSIVARLPLTAGRALPVWTLLATLAAATVLVARLLLGRRPLGETLLELIDG